MLDEIKISQVAAYILSKKSNKTMTILKLMKLLYFVDRKSLTKYGAPISYDNMAAMPFGMVLSQTYNLLTGSVKSSQNGWDNWVSDRENHQVSLKKGVNTANFVALSEADTDIIDSVLKQYGNKTGFKLADMQHDPKICPEWQDPEGSSITISYYDILVAIGFDKKTALNSAAEIDNRNAIAKALN